MSNAITCHQRLPSIGKRLLEPWAHRPCALESRPDQPSRYPLTAPARMPCTK